MILFLRIEAVLPNYQLANTQISKFLVYFLSQKRMLFKKKKILKVNLTTSQRELLKK